jgi:prevent-host-death family protein
MRFVLCPVVARRCALGATVLFVEPNHDHLTGHRANSHAVPMKSRTNKPSAGRTVIAASDFKARCLRILDDVASGRQVVITKRGEPIALVSPLHRREGTSRGAWKGLLEIEGDIVHADWSDEFEATRG